MKTTTESLTAFLELGEVLSALADSGRSTVCQREPDPFISDDPDERREAATACNGCPVLAACRRYAEAANERWFVWGGVDRGLKTGEDAAVAS